MVAIIDYGMGNVASVQKTLKKLNFSSKITREKEEISNAKVIILPGVGSFRAAMQNLHNFGLVNIIRENVLVKGKPILGICLGMQLLASVGFEDGETEGLNLVKGKVVKIPDTGLSIPHIGWNDITVEDNLYFKGIKDFNFYFVHSYYFDVDSPEYQIGTVTYGDSLTSVVMKEKILGTQFHPEKSQKSGLILLENFLKQNA